MTNIDELAQVLWEYNKLNQEVVSSDAILVLGSDDIRVAERSAELWKNNLAPLIIFSGKQGRLTQNWKETEAVVFSRRAEELGVAKESMIIEKESTNTGENIIFTQKILEDKGIKIESLVAVLKPFMERRAYATLQSLWPGINVKVTSPNISYEEYPNDIVTKEQVIHHLVGSTQRIKVYAERGWQIKQEIPDNVWSAYEELLKAGYTQELVE